MPSRLLLAYSLIALLVILSLAFAWYQVRRSKERHRDMWGDRSRRRR